MRRTVFEKQRRYTLNFPEGKFTEGEYICVMTNKSEALLLLFRRKVMDFLC